MMTNQELHSFISNLTPELFEALRMRTNDPMTDKLTRPFARKTSKGIHYIVQRVDRKTEIALDRADRVCAALNAINGAPRHAASAAIVTPSATTTAATFAATEDSHNGCGFPAMPDTESAGVQVRKRSNDVKSSEFNPIRIPVLEDREAADQVVSQRFTIALQLPRFKEVIGVGCLLSVPLLIVGSVWTAKTGWQPTPLQSASALPHHGAATFATTPRLRQPTTGQCAPGTATVATPVQPALRQVTGAAEYASSKPTAAATISASVPGRSDSSVAVEIGCKTVTGRSFGSDLAAAIMAFGESGSTSPIPGKGTWVGGYDSDWVFDALRALAHQNLKQVLLADQKLILVAADPVAHRASFSRYERRLAGTSWSTFSYRILEDRVEITRVRK